MMILNLMKRALFTLIFIWAPVVIFAQPLSLAECLRRAEQASFRIEAAKFRYQVAQQKASLKKARNLPQLYGAFSYERHGLASYGFYQQGSFVLSDWALGDFFLKTQTPEQKMAQAAKQRTQTLRLQVARRAVRLFIEALKQEKQNAFFKQRLNNLQLHRQVASALWQAGSKTELDVLQTESAILQLREKMENTRAKQQSVLDELALLIDWPPDDSLRIRAIRSAALAEAPAPNAQQVAWEKHPLLQAFRFNMEAALWEAKAARAAQIPHLQLSGGFVVDHDPTGDGNYWLAAIGMQFPLFQWNASQITVKKSHIRYQAIQSEQAAVRRQLRTEARKTAVKLEHLKKILQLQRQSLETSRRAYHIAEANYQAGLITNLEFLNAQEQFSEAQIALEHTQLDYTLQLADFYLLTNQPQKLESW